MGGGVMRKPNDRLLSLRVSEELRDAIEYHAKAHEVAMADVIRAALHEYLDIPKPGL
jgi:predicted HicB family RNase H-like nuclease